MIEEAKEEVKVIYVEMCICLLICNVIVIYVYMLDIAYCILFTYHFQLHLQ